MAYNLSEKEIKGIFPSLKLLPENAIELKSGTETYIIISDIHIGIESYFVSNGIFFPEYQLPYLKKTIKKLASKSKTLIINGDLKHNFKGFSIKEYNQVEEFLNYTKPLFKEIIVIKGNHDTIIEKITEKLKISLKNKLIIKDKNQNPYLIEHGHRKIKTTKNIIIGHEHPSVRISDSTGTGFKIPCFLVNKTQNQTIIVLPSFSPLSPGTDILKLNKSSFLTNVLKEKGINDFYIYGIYENEIFFLGKEKELI